MKKLLFIGGMGCLLLTGCKKEPMIHLNEEVQASIEAKQDDKSAEKNQEATTESQVETQTVEEEEVELEEETPSFTFDPSTWVKVEQPVNLNLIDYLPNKVNQLKTLSDGQQTVEQYVEFIDEAQLGMQVIERSNQKTEHTWYRWNDQQIILVDQKEDGTYFNNQIAQNLNQPTNQLILLQSPLQVGAVWNYDPTYQSEITAIYETAQIADRTYTNVIEVTSQLENDGTWRTYYAPEVGLLASVINDYPWVANQVTDNASLQQPITIYESKQLDNYVAELEPIEQTLEWQTNTDSKEVWTLLFEKMDWITSEIRVNQVVNLDDQHAQVDFTPGIVNAMNQHPHQEYGVIPSIVKTIGAYYNVPYVTLTVNGVPLAPDYLMFPENGRWQVDGDYKVEQSILEQSSIQESTSSQPETSSLEQSAE